MTLELTSLKFCNALKLILPSSLGLNSIGIAKTKIVLHQILTIGNEI